MRTITKSTYWFSIFCILFLSSCKEEVESDITFPNTIEIPAVCRGYSWFYGVYYWYECKETVENYIYSFYMPVYYYTGYSYVNTYQWVPCVYSYSCGCFKTVGSGYVVYPEYSLSYRTSKYLTNNESEESRTKTNPTGEFDFIHYFQVVADNGNLADSITVVERIPDLKPGELHEIRDDRIVEVYGDYSDEYNADYNNKVLERDENNNLSSIVSTLGKSTKKSISIQPVSRKRLRENGFPAIVFHKGIPHIFENEGEFLKSMIYAEIPEAANIMAEGLTE